MVGHQHVSMQRAAVLQCRLAQFLAAVRMLALPVKHAYQPLPR